LNNAINNELTNKRIEHFDTTNDAINDIENQEKSNDKINENFISLETLSFKKKENERKRSDLPPLGKAFVSVGSSSPLTLFEGDPSKPTSSLNPNYSINSNRTAIPLEKGLSVRKMSQILASISLDSNSEKLEKKLTINDPKIILSRNGSRDSASESLNSQRNSLPNNYTLVSQNSGLGYKKDKIVIRDHSDFIVTKQNGPSANPNPISNSIANSSFSNIQNNTQSNTQNNAQNSSTRKSYPNHAVGPALIGSKDVANLYFDINGSNVFSINGEDRNKTKAASVNQITVTIPSESINHSSQLRSIRAKRYANFLRYIIMNPPFPTLLSISSGECLFFLFPFILFSYFNPYYSLTLTTTRHTSLSEKSLGSTDVVSTSADTNISENPTINSTVTSSIITAKTSILIAAKKKKKNDKQRRRKSVRLKIHLLCYLHL
jgi:hypothetical protein